MVRDALISIYTVLIFWGAIVGVLSVVLHARVPWRESAMGRHLMFYMAVIAAVLSLSCFRLIFTWSQEWFFVLNVVVFALVPLAMTQRLWLQWKAQHPGDMPEDTPPHGNPKVESLR
jgi:hypothetical protein